MLSFVFILILFGGSDSTSIKPGTFAFRGNDGFVAGVTSLSNFLFANGWTVNPTVELEGIKDDRLPISPIDLRSGIRNDFESGYLFSGKIDPNLYDYDCEFTDPTLTFKGLTTFQKNIQAIQPLIKRFIGANLVTLYSLEQSTTQEKQIVAKWRMEGNIELLPWRPVIDVQGVTAYSYGDSGRIKSYFEEWTVEPAKALLGLFKPAGPQQKAIAAKVRKNDNRPAVMLGDVMEKLLRTVERKSATDDQIQELVSQLQAQGMHDTLRDVSLTQLCGGTWRLAYTNAKGGSNGKIGPVQGRVSQIFAVNPRPDGAIAFVNSVEIAGLVEIALDAVACERPKAAARGGSVVDVEFIKTTFKLAGIPLWNVSTAGKGYWEIIYSSSSVRIFTTNVGSLFILCKR